MCIRDSSWHIYEELGQVLIKKARALYITDPFRLDIEIGRAHV